MNQDLNIIDDTQSRIIMSLRVTAGQRIALQKAWQRTGEYKNRTQWIKAALNSFAGEEIFR